MIGRGWPARGWRKGAVLCALLSALAGMLGVAAPPPAQAGRWQVLDWTAPGRLRQVSLVQWQGQPALLATAGFKSPEKQDVTQMTLLRLGETAPAVAAQWPVPGFLRWVEPVQLAPGQGEWLGLRADGWYLGRVEGAALNWRRACACASVFGEKEDPDPLQSGFAQDLDGDGKDALVLPDRDGLMVYRWLADIGVMEPLWRYRWEAPLLRDPKDANVWQLPRYWMLDTQRSGTLDLIVHNADHLSIYRYPRLAPPRYALTGSARVRLESVTLPPGMMSALVALGDTNFPDAQRLLAALPLPTEPKLRGDWLAALPSALWVLQIDAKTVEPEAMPLPGAPQLHAGDYAFAVALEDLTGNGSLDLLQSAVITDNSPLGMRGEMRLFAGNVQEGRWLLPRPEKPITMGGAAVAELIRIGTRRDATPALLVASTEVTIGSILRSLSSGTVKLDLQLHLLQKGQFAAKPNQRTQLTVEDINTVGRPLVLAADVDGDGWRELLINIRPERMAAYPGSANGPRIGGTGMGELKSAVPRKPQETFIADFDGTGRESMVFWLRSGRYPQAQRRLVRFVRWSD